MELPDTPVQTPISKIGKGQTSNNKIIGIVIFQIPTIFLFLALLAGITKNALGLSKDIPGYKFGILASCLIFSIPLGILFNKFANFTSFLTSRFGQKYYTILGGIAWATALSICFQFVSISYLILDNPRRFLTVPWHDIARVLFKTSAIQAVIFCLFLVPIYFIYSKHFRSSA